jgi:DNA-binding response OmpR family regulator
MKLKKCIIVIEGELTQRQNFADALIVHGFDVFFYCRAEMVLNANILNYAAAIIINSELPGLNGWEAACMIRKKHLQVPLIMLVACNDANRYVNSFEKGVDDYIVKPIIVEELLNRLNILLEKHERKYGQHTYSKN